MTGLQTEFAFTLPKGFVDKQGQLHRQGTMRLATARDEIEPLRDPRVADADDPFLTVIVLSRVLTELGTVPQVTPNVVENLFAADLAFLQDFYGIINFGDPADLDQLKQNSAAQIHGASGDEVGGAGDDIIVIDDDHDGEADTDTIVMDGDDDVDSDEGRSNDAGADAGEEDSATTSGSGRTKKRSPHGRRAVIEEVKAGA